MFNEALTKAAIQMESEMKAAVVLAGLGIKALDDLAMLERLEALFLAGFEWGSKIEKIAHEQGLRG